MLFALALLPPADVEAGLKCVEEYFAQHLLTNKAGRLLRYLTIPCSLRTVSGLKIDFNVICFFCRYHKTQWMTNVTPASFSVHGQPRRTNNVQESFHSLLQRRMMKSRPGVWKFTGNYSQVSMTPKSWSRLHELCHSNMVHNSMFN